MESSIVGLVLMLWPINAAPNAHWRRGPICPLTLSMAELLTLFSLHHIQESLQQKATGWICYSETHDLQME